MRFKQATVTGTGAAINVKCGFVPDYVKVVNANAVTGEIMSLESFKAQADGDSFATTMIADDGTTSDINYAVEGTDGLSGYDKSVIAADDALDPVIDSGFTGFTIPAAFQAASDVLHYIAMAE